MLGIPSMLMTGRLDMTTSQEESAEPSWEGLDDPDDLWVEMPEGAHYSFITVCHDLDPGLLSLFIDDAVQDGCGAELIDTRESIPVLAAYVLAFGRRHVLGETEWDDPPPIAFSRAPVHDSSLTLTRTLALTLTLPLTLALALPLHRRLHRRLGRDARHSDGAGGRS